MSCRPTTLTKKYAGGVYTQSRTPEEFSDSIFDFVDIINKENNPAERYDRDTLVDTTFKFNTLMRRTDLTDYPLSDNRMIQDKNVSYIAFADFINQSGYTLNNVVSIVNSAYSNSNSNINFGGNTSNILDWKNYPTTYRGLVDQFEFYNNENVANTISGGMCGGFGNPFGKLLKIIAAIKAGAALLEKLKSFSLADLFDMALSAALDAIKEKLASIVDSLKSILMQQVNNLVTQVTSIVNGNIALFGEIKKRIEDVKDFFNDLTMEKLKDKIRSFVENAIAQFEELTPEAILLLLFRFCQFAEMIQGFLKSPVDAVRNYMSSIESRLAATLSFSLRNTELAVSAGATRLSYQARLDARLRMMETLRQRTNGANGGGGSNTTDQPGNFNSPDPERFVTDPNITEAEARELGAMTENGIPGKFIFSPQVKNMGKTVSDAGNDAGWKMINIEVMVKLLRVSTRLGTQLQINSGYRSPQYNKRIGGATRSQHMSGYAIDVMMAGLSSDQIKQFIRLASQEGFGGMKYYSGSGFTHVDIGARRTWGSSGAYQSWINMHLRDGFRNG